VTRTRTRTLLALTAVAALLAPAAAPAQTPASDGVVVKYKPGASLEQQRRVEQRAGAGELMDGVDRLGLRVVADGGRPAAVAARLAAEEAVLYAEPNFRVEPMAVPNDAHFSEQWGLHNTGQLGGAADADVNAPQAWSLAGLDAFPRSGGAPVAVIDTGVDVDHPDLAGAIAVCATSRSSKKGDATVKVGRCDDEQGHGTHVAGIVAATANNQVGVAGLAFNSPLIVCKALSKAGGTVVDVAQCLTFAHDQGAKVINLSLVAPESAALAEAAAYAYRDGDASGSLVVAAVGNDGIAATRFPAGYESVVSVAATDVADRRAPFSNFNADVELSAPGTRILSTLPGGGYGIDNGTSMAAPLAAAAAALVRGEAPAASAADVRAVLARCATDLGPIGRDDEFGFGRVDVLRALAANGDPRGCDAG